MVHKIEHVVTINGIFVPFFRSLFRFGCCSQENATMWLSIIQIYAYLFRLLVFFFRWNGRNLRTESMARKVSWDRKVNRRCHYMSVGYLCKAYIILRMTRTLLVRREQTIENEERFQRDKNNVIKWRHAWHCLQASSPSSSMLYICLFHLANHT